MKELFSGAGGRLSSKRVGGFVGLFLMLGITVFGVIQTPSSFVDALQVWALLVGGLLGAGVAEGWMQSRKPEQKEKQNDLV
ncbi:MAG: hypothetical protein AAF975_02045 [Spirochaetota bacterium]